MKTKNFIVTLFVLMLVSFNLLQAQTYPHKSKATTGIGYIPKISELNSSGYDLLNNSALYQNGSNYVGIGTGTTVRRTFQIHSTSANNHLFITGTAPAIAFYNSNASGELATIGLATGTNQFFYGTAANDFILRTTGSSGNLLFGTGYSSKERMRITSAGNVGIGGNFIPTEKLHIKDGRLLMQGETGIHIGSTSEVEYGYAFSISVAIDVTKAITVKSPVDKEVFKVMGDGQTFIDNILTANEIKVVQDAIPDYVFEENYNLKSIEDIEKYIKENKHLPEVPSAQEVKENGLNLGDMDAVLLKKIEELTLYVIELQKQINALQIQNGK